MVKKDGVSLITGNSLMLKLLERIDRVVGTGYTILLIGETGVGKEVLAEYIHMNSDRRDRPFIRISLSAVPSELVISELFGHERGAYTGARETRKGLFEMAHTGTIFLDDIDDVSLEVQVKLLRFLESRELRRVGGVKSIPVDVRIVTSSKIPLEELVRKKTFREDLYYRLNVVPVHIPPLRERRDDIPLLVRHFTDLFAPGRDIRFTPEAMTAMMSYHWPGNIRELRNVVQRLTLFSPEEIGKEELPPEITRDNAVVKIMNACKTCFLYNEMRLDDVLRCVESNLLKEALKSTHGNQSAAARLLKISLSTFRDKLARYSIPFKKYDRIGAS